MSDTATRSVTGQGRGSVVWPDPSPLDSWWQSVMYAEVGSAQRKQRSRQS